jgi:branched-chain amino acid aminotransferase
MKVWLNGAIMPATARCIDPADRGFTLGDGMFETIRVVDGKPQHLQRHLRRLRAGLAVLALPLALTDADLADAIAVALRANGLESAAVRLTVSRGPALRGVMPPPASEPTVLVASGRLPDIAAAADAITCTVTRRNEMSPLSRIKSLNFLDSVLARQEAARRGADEALLLNTRGYVAEATAANILVLRNGALVTPPVADGALPGIMREVLIERCDAREAPLLVEDLLAADAVFLSSSLALRPLASIDGRPIGTRSDVLADLARQAMAG